MLNKKVKNKASLVNFCSANISFCVIYGGRTDGGVFSPFPMWQFGARRIGEGGERPLPSGQQKRKKNGGKIVFKLRSSSLSPSSFPPSGPPQYFMSGYSPLLLLQLCAATAAFLFLFSSQWRSDTDLLFRGGGRVPFCYEKGGGGGKEEFTAVLSPLPPLCHKRNALLAQALPAKEEREEGKS